MTQPADMEAALEAILFVTSETVPRRRLLSIFDEAEHEEAALALERVLNRYRRDSGQGVMVDEVGGGVRLVTRPELNHYLRRFFEVTSRGRLSMAALETLTIVAYRQPITGPEIQELRGVNSSGVLKTLLERRLLRISGRKEVVGKPFLYCTTREFLYHFGINTLKDLPPLEELEESLAGEDEFDDGFIPREPDREEEILRQAAEIEDQASDGPTAGEVIAGEGQGEEEDSEEEDPGEEDPGEEDPKEGDPGEGDREEGHDEGAGVDEAETAALGAEVRLRPEV